MMNDKKMWTRADARAEMNRAVKNCKDAIAAIHVAAEKVRSISLETGFTPDASRALVFLRNNLAFSTLVKLSNLNPGVGEIQVEEIKAVPIGAVGVVWDPMSRGTELVRAGYKQISSKYRRVGRLPEGTSGLEALRAVDPDLVKRWENNLESQATSQFLRVYAPDGLVIELTEEEFADFKKAGGDTA